ncbi:DUF7577 domain-containing protein [Natranaeroarchaeum aerophilus]|uniref:Zinc ribbon domain-containing protein n=1 Tax=Natranaeroarchaeum aerophilus TaxID=2917711 RepID=A0AAE3FRV8_9EURY|nr:zinc ribbon domain-containing protein [Natranaeroarchaeum aerophilus]MCL9814492.1 zinc ribbon domain-containing protein [Natranaeroarchaeum aerophilus]
MEPSTLTILWRLAVTAFVIVAPTLLFLGLLRGLELLRDDELINKIADAEHLRVDDTDDLLRILSTDTVIDSDADPALDRLADATTTTRCQHCGAPNQSTATYCHDCLEPIG